MNFKLTLLFSLGFVLFTVIGTISHELGHVCVAKLLGFETELHFGSMNFSNSINDGLINIYQKNEYAIKNNLYFTGKAEYFEKVKRYSLECFLITIGGPLQTILTGTIGFFILYYRRLKNINFNNFDWILVFVALFWLRQSFNLVMSVSKGILRGNGKYFGGDEVKISKYLELSNGTFSIVLGVIGFYVLYFIMFRIIPKNTIFTFLFSGFLGGILGFYFWMYKIGPIVLP